jgi:hypothetical protein
MQLLLRAGARSRLRSTCRSAGAIGGISTAGGGTRRGSSGQSDPGRALKNISRFNSLRSMSRGHFRERHAIDLYVESVAQLFQHIA